MAYLPPNTSSKEHLSRSRIWLRQDSVALCSPFSKRYNVDLERPNFLAKASKVTSPRFSRRNFANCLSSRVCTHREWCRNRCSVCGTNGLHSRWARDRRNSRNRQNGVNHEDQDHLVHSLCLAYGKNYGCYRSCQYRWRRDFHDHHHSDRRILRNRRADRDICLQF